MSKETKSQKIVNFLSDVANGTRPPMGSVFMPILDNEGNFTGDHVDVPITTVDTARFLLAAITSNSSPKEGETYGN